MKKIKAFTSVGLTGLLALALSCDKKNICTKDIVDDLGKIVTVPCEDLVDAGSDDMLKGDTVQYRDEGCFDLDDDGYCSNLGADLDCDDSNPNIHPHARELCDFVDNDCDIDTDEGLKLGDPCENRNGVCVASGHYICDPKKNVICSAPFPRKPRSELCNNVDDDCDGLIDNVPFTYEIVDLENSIASASWAPDANRIAYTIEKYTEQGFGGFELRMFDFVERQDILLIGKVLHEGKEWEPIWTSWSPQNDLIAFTGTERFHPGFLGLTSLDGEVQVIDYMSTREEGTFLVPSWSPDGSQIAVGYGNGRGMSQLRVYNINDNSFTVIHENDGNLPKFIYSVIWGGNYKIYLTQLLETYPNGWPKRSAIIEMEPNGSSHRQVLSASHGAAIQHPILTALSPDAKRIMSSLGGARPENPDYCPRVYDLASGQYTIVQPCLEFEEIPGGRVIHEEWFWGSPSLWSADGTRWLGAWRALSWQAHGFIIYNLPCELRSDPSPFYHGDAE